MTDIEKVKQWFKTELSMREEESLDAIDCEDVMDICVKALEEKKQYNAIGTIEEFKHYKHTVHMAELAIDSVEKERAEIRNKAIDEFAEKLKEKATFLKLIENPYYGFVSEREIDEIAEQMKGCTDVSRKDVDLNKQGEYDHDR